ncbi:MAG: response regulator [Elusimicrobia bacterium CG11_big_fil_rev_8_21_14_0_20_64_6]|nr:MAG: response regulator [Elusimicrobia bacterium CG11_big_fil_rev_8_21_14_0_20_64_6]
MNNPQKKILVFEDNTSIQSLLKFFFQKRGVDIRIEGDGTAAVALALEFRPDLILMDYIMPGKDGVEALTDLRQAGVTVPIIMLSSKSFPADMERARAAGATAYLVKPFNPKELEAAIKPYLLS